MILLLKSKGAGSYSSTSSCVCRVNVIARVCVTTTIKEDIRTKGLSSSSSSNRTNKTLEGEEDTHDRLSDWLIWLDYSNRSSNKQIT